MTDTTNRLTSSTDQERYYAEAWTRHAGEGGGTAYAVFDRTTSTFAAAEAGGFYSAFESLTSAEQRATELNAEQRVCVVCTEDIQLVPGHATVYEHTRLDGVDARGHLALPKLAHPMDQDPFAGLD